VDKSIFPRSLTSLSHPLSRSQSTRDMTAIHPSPNGAGPALGEAEDGGGSEHVGAARQRRHRSRLWPGGKGDKQAEDPISLHQSRPWTSSDLQFRGDKQAEF
jgi:hypothetical protein